MEMPRKKSFDFYDSDYWIQKFLINMKTDSVGATFGEIKAFLRSKKMDYDKKGLSLRLNELIKTGKIAKLNLPNHRFPVYIIAEKQMENTQYLAQIFASRFSNRLLKLVDSRESSTDENKIKEYVIKCGIFTFYNLLHAWKLGMGQDKSKKTDESDFSQWWQNSAPMPALPTFWNIDLQQMSELTDVEKIGPFSYSTKKVKQIKKIESILDKLFPEEIKIGKEEMKNLKSNANEKIKIKQDAKKLGLNIF